MWSGTSFAVPVLAGEIAQHLIDDKMLEPAPFEKSTHACTPDRAVDRGWDAVSKTLAGDAHPLTRPSGSASPRRRT
jgi:hypothetical protein